MSVTTILRMVAVLKEFGVPVSFESGWETRGNGQSSAYEGGIVHHTATAYSNTRPQILVTGRSDLAGPLCNFAGLANGTLHVVAAHPANHAGASGGKSMGPLPVTSLFNRRVVGLEIVYPGTQPMTPEQYRSAKTFAIAVRRVFGQPHHEWTRGHAETSITGKWDPGYAPGKTISMSAFRSEAAALEATGGDDFMSALSDKQQGELYEATMQIREQMTGTRNLAEFPGYKNLPNRAPGEGTLAEQVAQIHRESTQRLPSRSELAKPDPKTGKVPEDTVLGWAINADARASEAKALAKAAVDGLTALNTKLDQVLAALNTKES